MNFIEFVKILNIFDHTQLIMAIKPHLKLNTKAQIDKSIKLKFNYGFGESDQENKENKDLNFARMARSFREQVTNFRSDFFVRRAERTLEVPAHINYVLVQFHGQFHIPKYFQEWYNDFGLTAVNYSKFNTEVLFAVSDTSNLRLFLTNIRNFIKRELEKDLTVTYNGKVRYIKNFSLLTSTDILKVEENSGILNFTLTDFPLKDVNELAIRKCLFEYLDDHIIEYKYSDLAKSLEVYNITLDQGREIVKNFDIIKNVTSSLATVIAPNKFNQPERGYGFEIENGDEDLPIIGILDTGISLQTPLAAIIVNDDTFNLTGSSAFIDNANRGSGHGTGVAALAALGRRPYLQNYTGLIKSDAKVLSMKILDNNSGYISQDKVVELLKEAHRKHGVSIFVLTICFNKNKEENEDFSVYAHKLDVFAYENDCLIFICTSNNNDAVNDNTDYNFEYFHNHSANLSVPAESMNNMTIGAVADSLRSGVFYGISPQREFPTLYTRKGHINLSKFKNKENKLYFKPDVVECGGDFEKDGNYIGTGSNATMNVLSADPAESFYQDAGTSFSAPLAANIAAQIKNYYPEIKSQSVKALILNASCLDAIVFPNEHNVILNRTAGYGLVNPEKSTLSNDDSITILVEDNISPEEFRSYPINFPEYLRVEDVGKKLGLLKVTATLCFSFQPVLNNQLAYCPIHMAFSFYRNHTGDQIQEIEKTTKSKLKTTLSWSQNGRKVQNPIPYSNSQKIEFPVNLNELVDENGTFKLAVHCRVCPQLTADKLGQYNHPHEFSIAIRIENKLSKSAFKGRLYNEMEQINNLDSILRADADLSLENEA